MLDAGVVGYLSWAAILVLVNRFARPVLVALTGRLDIWAPEVREAMTLVLSKCRELSVMSLIFANDVDFQRSVSAGDSIDALTQELPIQSGDENIQNRAGRMYTIQDLQAKTELG